MISRRGFFAAASALAMTGLPIRKLAAAQALKQSDLLAFPSIGQVTLLHFTDLHAQLKPIYFREPSVNIGVGDAKGHPPHLTEAAFRREYGIVSGTPAAYSLTAEDYVALAKDYGKMGGLDRIATVVRSIRDERGDNKVLLLDGGDTWHGSWSALQTRGGDMVECTKLLKPDAMVGHFEFTLGQDRVKELADQLGTHFLAGNIIDEWKEAVFPAMAMYEKGGIKIAVIGQAFPFTPIANPRWMVPDWTFGIQEERLRAHVAKARADGAELVVLLSHNGYDVDRKIAKRVEGIDVILCGHTHDAVPKPESVGHSLLVSSGCYGKFVTRLDLAVRNGRIATWRHKLIPIFSDAIEPEPAMAKAIAKVRAPFETELKRELAVSESLLYRRGNVNGSFDDLICHAMLEQRDVEIALSPGFRWGPTVLPGDPIMAEDVYAATAITYPQCYRSTMTGTRLHDVLEDVADNLFNPDPYFQQGGDMVRVGGISYTFEPTAKMGNRVRDMVLLRTGEQIQPDKSYTVSGWASIAQNVEGPPIWSVVEAWLKDHPTVKVDPAPHVKLVGA